jgi:hypothetical protein
MYLCGVKIIVMIKYIKRKLKRRTVRKKLLELKNLYDIVDPNRLADINDCKFIFRNTLKHTNSIYEIAPLSSHRLIENKKLGVFVILDNKKITIINHVCYYSNIPMSDRDWNKMITMFDNKVQENRMKRIEQMKSQVEYSLSKLKNRMIQKTKPQN